MTESRELTRDERSAIKKLVISMCANYDREYGCLPLDCDCYMLGKWWTGSYCKYFKNAVLPLDPILESALIGGSVQTRPCAVCGTPFIPNGKKAYCSAACANESKKKKQRGYMRERRGRC